MKKRMILVGLFHKSFMQVSFRIKAMYENESLSPALSQGNESPSPTLPQGKGDLNGGVKIERIA